ncbi:FadR/GntR family transcriptional regulator [Actinokineospora sp. UTMC 2448]|uniref:FadR/GntR family transcriptional regulator n=1 Tax=Actinokineospora sp. UTMC 2448 TaxID=2268449 RepID=UPI002164D073|nr:FCD domain-containing protein [Actinokineospora sp. UTMC 2448]UVS80096.1 L-lactate utilization operon repressor [Actinokineospora sp. UTMC 2448]
MTNGMHARVLAELGAEIVSGALPPGSVLRLEGLQCRFGVSRTAAREVVRVLEALRLTTSKRRVGITVRERDEWNHYDPLVIRWQLDGPGRVAALRALTELRHAVEPTAARCAAARATPEQRGALADMARRLAAATGDLNAFLDHDIAFHGLVLRASGNPMFRQLSAVVAEVLRGRTGHGLMPERPAPEAVALHATVAAAIADGAAERAEAAMRALVVQAHDEVAELARD